MNIKYKITYKCSFCKKALKKMFSTKQLTTIKDLNFVKSISYIYPIPLITLNFDFA